MNEVERLARLSGKSRTVIYKLAKRFGRMPTLEEIKNRKNGRPRKYEFKEEL